MLLPMPMCHFPSSGMGTAVVQALITNPYELIKIRQQTVVGQVGVNKVCEHTDCVKVEVRGRPLLTYFPQKEALPVKLQLYVWTVCNPNNFLTCLPPPSAFISPSWRLSRNWGSGA